jgi:hypothetical protein
MLVDHGFDFCLAPSSFYFSHMRLQVLMILRSRRAVRQDYEISRRF